MAGEFYEIYTDEEHIIVEYPDKAVTMGISGCIGIGILNHKLKRGYLKHHGGRNKYSDSLIKRAINDAQNIGDLEVALAGNIPLSEEDAKINEEDFYKSLNESREHGKWALEMIKSKGINAKKIQNHLQIYPSKDCYNILIDTEKGKIEVEKVNLGEEE